VNARVVDEETPSLPPVSPIIEATPMEETEPTETQLLKSLFRSWKFRIISALAVMLVVGLIVAVVLLTQDSSKALSSSANTRRLLTLYLLDWTLLLRLLHHPHRLDQLKDLPTLLHPAHSLIPLLLQGQALLPQRLL
jgi:hypothetical protein